MRAYLKNKVSALSDSMSDLMGSEKEDAAPHPAVSPASPRDKAMVKQWGVTRAQEAALIERFRQELQAELNPLPPSTDKLTLRRFLRARKHSLSKAKGMFLDQLEWRKANDVDSVLHGFKFEERDRFFEYYPEGFYGTDRLGRPVYVQQPGKVNTDELWKFTTMERCVRYHIQQQERYLNVVLPSASLASGKIQEQSIVLLDMDGVGVSTLTGEVRKILALIMEIDQDNYPELMYKTLIINAPTTFRVLWAMVRHLMDARTQAKIEVLPADYHAELQAYIAPENLMQQYGGSNPAPLIKEPGPWQDAKIKAELGHKGKDWAQGLPSFDEAPGGVEIERRHSASVPATVLAGDVDERLPAGVGGGQGGGEGGLVRAAQDADTRSVQGEVWGSGGQQARSGSGGSRSSSSGGSPGGNRLHT
ncbi:hypothetical protein N2152v2_002853 [Parachlorella kessleri]